MAVLKDLIVHGASRFLNTANYTTAKGGVLAADKGVFNKLIATDAEIENLNVDELNANNLTAQNATVVGLLDVQGELHTNSWTNANIANIGGSFYISPTLSSAASSVTISLNTSVTPNTYTITVSGGSFVTSSTGITWSPGSRVMVTGSIKRNNISYPLGTCTGNLNAISSTGFTVTDIKISNVNSAIPGDSTVNGSLATIVKEFGSGTTFTSEKITISMYEIGPSGSYKPVGILLTSYGLNKETYIDIYGGVNPKNTNTTDNIPDGFTDPNVRIGYLGGLPAYTDSANNSHQPTGWGIYTDNGYFKGVIVADSGLVGGWTIDSNSIHSSDKNIWDKDEDGIFIGNYIDESYFLTEDTERKSGKTYYEYNSQTRIYSEVQNPASNPKQSSYYEKKSQSIFTIAGGKIQYARTDDITVNPNNDYYSYNESTGEYTKIVNPSGNPSAQEWYVNLGPMWYINSDGSASFGSLLVNQTGKLDVPAASISGKLTADQIEVRDLGAISANIGSTINSETTSNSFEANSKKKVVDSTDTREIDYKEYIEEAVKSNVNELEDYHEGDEYLLETFEHDSYVLMQTPAENASLTTIIYCNITARSYTKVFTYGTDEEYILDGTDGLIWVEYDGQVTFTVWDGFDGTRLVNITYQADTTVESDLNEIVEESFIELNTEKNEYILTEDSEVKNNKNYYKFNPNYSLTNDETIGENKVYYNQFIEEGDTDFSYSKVSNPAANPKENNYYESHPKYDIVNSPSGNPSGQDLYEINSNYSSGITLEEGMVSIISNEVTVASTGKERTSLDIYKGSIIGEIKIGNLEVTSDEDDLIIRLG